LKIKISDTFTESMEKTFNPNIFRRISLLFSNIKWAIKNLFRYRKVIYKTRPWDYAYIIIMMKFQLNDLCKTIEKYGREVDESRLPKVEDMKRAIELLHNHIEDNYHDRCGYEEDAFKLSVENNVIELVRNAGYENYDQGKVFDDGHELEKKEWNELFKLLKKMRGWWD